MLFFGLVLCSEDATGVPQRILWRTTKMMSRAYELARSPMKWNVLDWGVLCSLSVECPCQTMLLELGLNEIN